MVRRLKLPNSEKEITDRWKYIDKVYVSVICNTFNQEEYVAEAIESFLAQKTKYRFEIILHDDASTDGTRNVAIDYQRRYPSIIKLILPRENQYSLNRHIPFRSSVDMAQGEFIALCEGDDFWIDYYKLENQIKHLLLNRDINFVISRGVSLFPNGETKLFNDLGEEVKKLSFIDAIVGPKIDFFPTASFFMRKNVLNNIPEWIYEKAPVGDYYVQLFASYNSGLIYLPEPMVTYRRSAMASYNLTKRLEGRLSDDKARVECKYKLMQHLCLTDLEVIKFRERIFKFNLSIVQKELQLKNYFKFISGVIELLSSEPALVYKLLCYKFVKICNPKK